MGIVDQLKDKETPQEEKDAIMRMAWVNVFSTEEGRVVFNDLMVDLQLNSTVRPDDVANNALQAEAKYIIAGHMGIENFKAVTDSIIDLAKK